MLCVLMYASLNGENGAVFREGRQGLRNKDSISQSADRPLQRYLQPHCNAAKEARGAYKRDNRNQSNAHFIQAYTLHSVTLERTSYQFFFILFFLLQYKLEILANNLIYY